MRLEESNQYSTSFRHLCASGVRGRAWNEILDGGPSVEADVAGYLAR